MRKHTQQKGFTPHMNLDDIPPKSRVRRTNSCEGFTLIEVIVATAVFLVVMLISAGSLLALIDANRKAQSQKSVINNLNFALDSMTRAIRVGTTYHCGSGGVIHAPQDCSNGGNYFAFEKSGGSSADISDQVVFRLNSSRIERSNDSGQNFEAITSTSVVIDRLEFTALGTDPSDTAQPRVTIIIQGKVGGQEESESRFNIQTVVSQRLID